MAGIPTAKSTKLTASANIKALGLIGMLVGVDGATNPEITIYDGLTAAGEEIIPTNTYDGTKRRMYGFFVGGEYAIRLVSRQMYVEITCAGTVEVVVYYV